MQKHFRILLVMVVTAASSFAAVAQSAVYKAVILDGKPSKLNIKTGVITTINGKALPSYVAGKTIDSIKKGRITSVDDNLVKLPLKSKTEEKGSTHSTEPRPLNSVEIGAETKALEPKSVIFHTVVEGETLYGLSKRYQTSLGALQKANNLETTRIRTGQTLRVSDLNVVENDPNPIWIVVEGDTLYSIAKKTNTTVTRLKMLNDLKGNTIQVGQELQIR
jgi:LysM repeat protein